MLQNLSQPKAIHNCTPENGTFPKQEEHKDNSETDEDIRGKDLLESRYEDDLVKPLDKCCLQSTRASEVVKQCKRSVDELQAFCDLLHSIDKTQMYEKFIILENNQREMMEKVEMLKKDAQEKYVTFNFCYFFK